MTTPILVVAGEQSGEEHALTFIDSLISNAQDSLEFFGVGGPELQKKGMENIYDMKDFSMIGFSGVLKKYPYYKRAFNHLLEEVDRRNCKNAILIDFQTFNLKLASELHKRGVRVFYYVAPQAWAWKAWRVKTLARVSYALFTILGFEKKWFSDRGVKNVISVPHPIINKYKNDLNQKVDKKDEILFLPGSRNSEVEEMLPVFLKVASQLRQQGYRCSIVKTESVKQHHYDLVHESFDSVYNSDQVAQAINHAFFSFAASGTVTLSLALFQVPTIVCYRVNLFNEFILRNIVKQKGVISLANIVHQEVVFPEYLQDDMQVTTLITRFLEMMNQDNYNQLVKKLAGTKKLLAGQEEDVGQYIANHLL